MRSSHTPGPRGAALVLALFACDVAAPEGEPMVNQADDVVDGAVDSGASGDARAGESSESNEPSAPSPRDEALVSSGGEVGQARDDLFPDLAGDDLVWLRVWLDTSLASVDAATDCMSCPGCHGCRFDVMHRRLPDGETRVLDDGRLPRTGPRVGGGLASWVDDQGRILVRNLAGESHEVVTTGAWLPATPLPYEGRLWWLAWDNTVQSYAIFAHDVASSTRERVVIVGYLFEPYWFATSQFAQLGQRQQFTVGAHGIDFVTSDDARSVRRWAWQGTAAELAASDDRVFARVVQRADGAVVTVDYPADEGCAVDRCELALHVLDHEGLRRVAPDARPSRYASPVAGGDTVVWLDRRDGGYQVYAAGSDGSARRLSSDVAQIGAISTLAANERGAVWADRRTGRWRLMWRAFD